MNSWQKELDMTDLRVWPILLWEEHLRAGGAQVFSVQSVI